MLENLTVFVNRLEELDQCTFDPVVAADAEGHAKLMKEHKNLESIAEKYREYLKAVQTVEDSTEMLGEPGPKCEMKEMIRQELDDAKDQAERTAEELKILPLSRGLNGECNVIMEIRDGAGGEEAALFSAWLFRIYSIYATRRGWKTEFLNVSETELGGYKGISFQIMGDGVYLRLKYENSVHRAQRMPEMETQGRTHTPTATVAALPEVDDVEIEINPTDLQINTYRASDVGGQHVNKMESVICITHLPMGMVVECQDERSQFKNKNKAMKVLRLRLYEAKRWEQDAQVVQQRKSRVGTGDRSERIRTYNFPQGRLIDHRTGLIIYRLEEMLSGDLDEVTDVLVIAGRVRQLEETIDRQE